MRFTAASLPPADEILRLRITFSLGHKLPQNRHVHPHRNICKHTYAVYTHKPSRTHTPLLTHTRAPTHTLRGIDLLSVSRPTGGVISRYTEKEEAMYLFPGDDSTLTGSVMLVQHSDMTLGALSSSADNRPHAVPPQGRLAG